MQQTFAGNQDLLDTLWGYYFATGSHLPILRIMQMLPWSKSRDTVDKLTVGSMARYTLASYAVRDASLREYLRSELAEQPEAVKVPLTEVVEAADTVQLGAVRKDALAAVEELKAKGSDARRNLDFWGQVGVGAVALGCVSAAALGQVAVGIPCVIGGSASPGPAVVLGKAAIVAAGRGSCEPGVDNMTSLNARQLGEPCHPVAGHGRLDLRGGGDVALLAGLDVPAGLFRGIVGDDARPDAERSGAAGPPR